MSTDNTLFHYRTPPGVEIRLFSDVLDEESLHLEIKGTDFTCTPEGITVALPPLLWEAVRQCAARDFPHADLTDAQIEAKAREEVTLRRDKIADFEATQPRPGRWSVWHRYGVETMGSPEEPFEVQVATAIASYRAERDLQRRHRDGIKAMVEVGRGGQARLIPERAMIESIPGELSVEDEAIS